MRERGQQRVPATGGREAHEYLTAVGALPTPEHRIVDRNILGGLRDERLDAGHVRLAQAPEPMLGIDGAALDVVLRPAASSPESAPHILPYASAHTAEAWRLLRRLS